MKTWLSMSISFQNCYKDSVRKSLSHEHSVGGGASALRIELLQRALLGGGSSFEQLPMLESLFSRLSSPDALSWKFEAVKIQLEVDISRKRTRYSILLSALEVKSW